MSTTPIKLKVDAIVEALFELQFNHDQQPEVVVGQLAASENWSGYTTKRQPVGELPISMLTSDPDLRFQPTLQLDRPEPGEVIRIGPRVLSLHVLKPYPGWTKFLPRLKCMISSLYGVLKSPEIHRAGLRYINALTPEHGFKSFWDLDFDLRVKSGHPSDVIMSGYVLDLGAGSKIQVKLASPQFVGGETVEGAVAYVDVDVQTTGPLGKIEANQLEEWLVRAHEEEKKAFFALWPDDKLEAMRA